MNFNVFCRFLRITWVSIPQVKQTIANFIIDTRIQLKKYSSSLKSVLQQVTCISQLLFYGDLIYKLKKMKGNNRFSTLFIKTISKLKQKAHRFIRLCAFACIIIVLIGGLYMFVHIGQG